MQMKFLFFQQRFIFKHKFIPGFAVAVYAFKYAVRIFGSSHYEKSAISSWNFAFAVLYCRVFILTNRKGKKTNWKTLEMKNRI